jgi:excisionase family DNA binding protein
MRANVLADLEQRVLADLVRSFAATHSVANQRSSLIKKPVRQVAPAGESLCSYLRSIRHWIVTRDVAVLLHCHTETIYRRVKIEGLPAHRDGRTLKYYPPEIADWLERRNRK